MIHKLKLLSNMYSQVQLIKDGKTYITCRVLADDLSEGQFIFEQVNNIYAFPYA